MEDVAGQVNALPSSPRRRANFIRRMAEDLSSEELAELHKLHKLRELAAGGPPLMSDDEDEDAPMRAAVAGNGAGPNGEPSRPRLNRTERTFVCAGRAAVSPASPAQ